MEQLWIQSYISGVVWRSSIILLLYNKYQKGRDRRYFFHQDKYLYHKWIHFKYIYIYIYIYMPVPVTARSKAYVCSRSPAEIMGSNPTEGMDDCCECCVLGLCDELITRPEEFYRLWCIVVCDLETSRMRRSWPALGRSATRNTYIYIYIYTHTSKSSNMCYAIRVWF